MGEKHVSAAGEAGKAAGNDTSHGSFKSYTVGFGLSVLVTLGAYLAVTQHVLGRTGLIAVIFALAVVQLVVQLLFFLHLGREGKPRLNLMSFLFMLLVLVIVVAGSLWIMNNLNYHMTPQDLNRLQGGGF
ncbi:MAG TPA: cytochrome o ubiquinol oxidase subunit IV [Candidatus Saccharimonadales bacterium]|nr:cytochrome o ubiquinol oxidase subunit IV [Candidatus Saccharimonadales bacterium]